MALKVDAEEVVVSSDPVVAGPVVSSPVVPVVPAVPVVPVVVIGSGTQHPFVQVDPSGQVSQEAVENRLS